MNLLANIIFLLLFNGITSQIMTRFASPKCYYDSDCGINAFCKDNSNCVCKAGYLHSNRNSTLCLREAVVIGGTCIEDIQCTSAFGSRAECFQERQDSFGRCQCLPGTHFEDKLCYPSISLGGYCQVSAECKAKSSASTYCDAGRCVCSLDYHPTRDGMDCLKSSDIGELCKTDDECVALNSQCIEVCRCKPDYVLSYDGKICLPIVNSLGKKCQEDSQCQKNLLNSVCNSVKKQCSCSITSTLIDGYCWNIADLGESCSDSRECIIKSNNSAAVTCLNNKCSCTKGFKPNFRINDCSGAISSNIINRLDFRLIMSFNLIFYILINHQ